MREAITLFVWLLVVLACVVAIVVVAMAIFDYIFVPFPYHDPEPPITPPGS